MPRPEPDISRESPEAPRPWLAALGLVAVLVTFAALFWPSLPVPFERDEGEYAHAADLLAAAKLPYRDAFIQKPPGIVLVYRVVFATLGRGAADVHLALLAAWVLLLVLVHRLGRSLGAPGSGLVAAAILALALAMPVYETHPANCEAFMVVFTAAAMLGLAALPGRPSIRIVCAVGVCAGLATWFKQVAVFHLLHLAAGVLWVGAGTRRGRFITAFGACAALPWLITAGWYAAHGAVPHLVDGVLLHNLEYVGANPEGGSGSLLLRRLAAFAPFDWVLWIGGILATAALVALRRGWLAFLVGGWLLASLAGIAVGGYFRGHYLIQALPPLALAVALGSAQLGRVPQAAVAALLAGAWLVARPWIFGLGSEEQMLQRYGHLRFANSVEIGERLRRAGCRSLFVLASEPQIYHYSGCRAVSPMVLMNPLFGGYPSSHRRQQQTIEEIRADLPDWVVLAPPGSSVPMFDGSDPWFYRQVAELVSDRYALVGLTLLRRRGLLDPGGVDLAAIRPDLLLFQRIR